MSRELCSSGCYCFIMNNTEIWLETVLLLFLMVLQAGLDLADWSFGWSCWPTQFAHLGVLSWTLQPAFWDGWASLLPCSLKVTPTNAPPGVSPGGLMGLLLGEVRVLKIPNTSAARLPEAEDPNWDGFTSTIVKINHRINLSRLESSTQEPGLLTGTALF